MAGHCRGIAEDGLGGPLTIRTHDRMVVLLIGDVAAGCHDEADPAAGPRVVA